MSAAISITPFDFVIPGITPVDNNKKFNNINLTLYFPEGISKTSIIFSRATLGQIHSPSNSTEMTEIGPQQALVGPLVINGAEVIGDFTGHIRQQFDTAETLFGTRNEEALAALGLTSGFNLAIGGLSIKSGIDDIKAANKISDVKGKALGYLKVAKGTAQVAGGAVTVPVRALTLAALATASKVDAVIAGVLGGLGSLFSGALSVFVGAILSLRIHETRILRKDLNKILDDKSLSEEARYVKALEFLKAKAAVSPEEREKIRAELGNLPDAAKKIAEEESKLLLKKEALLKRVTDDACLDSIRTKGAAEAKSVVEEVQNKSQVKLIIFSIELTLVVVGLAVSIASCIFLGPVPLMILSAIGLAVSIGWLITDGYQLYQCFKDGDPGRLDKLWIFLSTAIAIVSISLVFFLSGGIPALVAATVVGTVWLGINIACYYRIQQVEKKISLTRASNK